MERRDNDDVLGALRGTLLNAFADDDNAKRVNPTRLVFMMELFPVSEFFEKQRS